jgi:hypothetical protein
MFHSNSGTPELCIWAAVCLLDVLGNYVGLARGRGKYTKDFVQLFLVYRQKGDERVWDILN